MSTVPYITDSPGSIVNSGMPERAQKKALETTQEIKQKRRDQRLIAVDDPDDPIVPPKPAANTSHP